ALHARVVARPLGRRHHVVRILRGVQDVVEQRVGVERDRRQQRIELRLVVDPRVRIQRAERDHQADKDADEPFHAANCRPRKAGLLHQCVTRCAGMKGATRPLMKRIAALCIAFAAGGAWGQLPSATEKYFEELDLNGDGYVSLAEAAGNEEVVKRFDKADRNRDGKLSRKEFANLKNVKVRVAAKKKPPSAAVGGTAPRNK